MSDRDVTGNEDLQEAIAKLLPSIATDAAQLQPLSGGRNNRVFRVDTPRGPCILKQYFTHPGDIRDRQLAEAALLSLCATNGIGCVPRIISHDRQHRVTLMEFVEGRRLEAGEVQTEHVDQARAFFHELNGGNNNRQLSDASEAAFSLDQHLQLVGRRVERLATIPDASQTHIDARQLVKERLLPAWQTLRESVLQQAAQVGVAPNRDLTAEQRCISPSDFGFHNTILRPDGRLCFIDFEYAGHDDPARMVCDFFCQVEVPVPRGELPRFVESIAESSTDPDAFRLRADLLMPVYQVKWCCIVLNDFLPTDAARRAFSTSNDRHSAQLELATRLLRELPS